MRPAEIDELLAALDEVMDRWIDEAVDGIVGAFECGRDDEEHAACRELAIRQRVKTMLGAPPFDIPNLINAGALRTEYAHEPERLEGVLQGLADIVAASRSHSRESLASQVENSTGNGPTGHEREASELGNSPGPWKAHPGSALKKTDAGTYLCVDNESGERVVEEFKNIEAAIAYLAGIEVDGLGLMMIGLDECTRFDHRISEAREVSSDSLVSCRLDNCNRDYSEGGGEGLRALVDLEGTSQRRYGCAVAYFPMESASEIVSLSHDPMVGDDAIYWSGDNLVQSIETDDGDEVDYIIPPVIIDEEPYWKVGEDYMWVALEGPDALHDVMPCEFDADDTAPAPVGLDVIAQSKTDEALLSNGIESKANRNPEDRDRTQR